MSVGANPIFIKTLNIDNNAGVGQYLAVVQGAESGGCKLPTAANAKGFIGITHESQPNQNKGVPVSMIGTERAVMAGAVTRGDRLNIAGVSGKLQSCEAAITAAPNGTAAVYNVVAEAMESCSNDGDVIPVKLNSYIVNLAAS